MIRNNIIDELENYKKTLTDSYKHDAWNYFDYEDLKVHLIWNGYKCSKCNSQCALKNKEGLCVKCLVLKEKIDVVDKIIKKCKEVESNGRK